MALLLAPLRLRKNVMAVGRNYRDHAKEFSDSGFDASEKQMIPDAPVIFTKAPTSVVDFDGSTRVFGADVVYKYDAGGAAGRGAVTLQGEYARRTRKLDTQEIAFAGGATAIERFKETQDGAYLQAVYGIAPRWTVGLRLEQVGMTNETTFAGGDAWGSSKRATAMAAWMPTEFSRLRLQFSRGNFSVDDGARDTFNQLFLQWQMSMGAHGAHAF